MSIVVNLTPHAITVVGAGGSLTIPPSGTVARVEVTPDPDAGDRQIVVDGIAVPIRTQLMGAIVGLPEPRPGTVYVVSLPVAQAVRDRDDVVSPGPLVRDEQGRPVACEGLLRTVL